MENVRKDKDRLGKKDSQMEIMCIDYQPKPSTAKTKENVNLMTDCGTGPSIGKQATSKTDPIRAWREEEEGEQGGNTIQENKGWKTKKTGANISNQNYFLKNSSKTASGVFPSLYPAVCVVCM